MAIPEMKTITMPDENGNDETYEIVDKKSREAIASLSEEIADHEGDANKHITSSERTEWNNKSNFSGSYDDLTNKPIIPTNTSQLMNDSGFLTSVPSEYVTDGELTAKGYAEQVVLDELAEKYGQLVDSLKFDVGTVDGENIAAGTYRDVNITFNKRFDKTPIVFFNLISSSKSSDLGKISAAYVPNSGSATGCTIRIFNGATATRSPGLEWKAMNRDLFY